MEPWRTPRDVVKVLDIIIFYVLILIISSHLLAIFIVFTIMKYLYHAVSYENNVSLTIQCYTVKSYLLVL